MVEEVEFIGIGGEVSVYETGNDDGRYFLGSKDSETRDIVELTGSKEELIKFFEDSIKYLKQY